MAFETASPNETEIISDDDLLNQYKNVQLEIARLIKARDPKGGATGMLEVLSHLHNPQYFDKRKEMFGDAVVQKFAELHKLQNLVNNKGLKPPTMEELGL